jgi:hypothetical protein
MLSKTKITIVAGSLIAALAGNIMFFITLLAMRDLIPGYFLVAGPLVLLVISIRLFASLRKLFRQRCLGFSSWPLILLLMGSDIGEGLLFIFMGYSIRIWLPSFSDYLIATGSIMALIVGSTILYVVFSEFRGKFGHA